MEMAHLLSYSDNSRQVLYDTLAAHPEALNVPIQTIGAYKTIAQQVAHMIGAEQRWTQQRLEDGERPPRYEDTAPIALDALYADWDSIRVRFRVQVDAGNLDRRIPFSLPNWNDYKDTVTAEQIIVHVVTHQYWHTAQVSLMLQMQGIDPPVFDYIFLHGGPQMLR